MANILTRPDSRFWIASFGRRKVSTKIPVKGKDKTETNQNERKAQAVADALEIANRGDASVNQLQRVMAETAKRVSKRVITSETVKTFTERWIKMKENECGAGTVSFYKATLVRFMGWLEERADRNIADIHPEDIRKFLNFRRERVSPKTANHELKSLRTFFRAARAEQQIPENPTEFIKAAAEKKVTRRPFTLKEIQAVLKVADPEWRSMILCALYTGQRLSDIATMTWQNVDLESSEIRLATRKTGKRLIIPMPESLRKHLEGMPSADDPKAPLHPRAWESIRKTGRAGALSREFGELLGDAGLRTNLPHRKKREGRDGHHNRHEVSFHTFRRTATTWLHEAGVPAAVVQALIGHDSLDEHEGYIAVGRDALRKAAATFPSID